MLHLTNFSERPLRVTKLEVREAGTKSPLAAEGLPFVLDEFVLLGAYEDFDRLGSAPWQPAAAGSEKSRSRGRPASNAVVESR